MTVEMLVFLNTSLVVPFGRFLHRSNGAVKHRSHQAHGTYSHPASDELSEGFSIFSHMKFGSRKIFVSLLQLQNQWITEKWHLFLACQTVSEANISHPMRLVIWFRSSYVRIPPTPPPLLSVKSYLTQITQECVIKEEKKTVLTMRLHLAMESL